MPLVSKTFDQLLDFTRTSSATFVGSNGLIQNTAASRNLLTQTQQFDNAAWAKARATVTANAAVAPDGTTTADKLVEDTTASNSHFAYQAITVSATAYAVSFYAKAAERSWCYVCADNTTVLAYFDLANGVVGSTSGVTSANISSVGDGWYRCTIIRTFAAGERYPGIGVANADNGISYTGNGTSGLFIWGAQLEAAAAATTYTRNNGGRFPPRFDYDPVTLAAKGLLIEEQRANLLLQSETFDSGTWSKFQATITANAAVSPDGTADADALVEDANTGTHFCQQFFTFANATAYTMSAYVKAGTRAWCTLLFPSAAFGSSVGSYFNLSGAGALGAAVGSPTARTITAVGNGWYRVTVTATTTAAAGGNLPISAASADNTNSYAGVNGTTALFLYGAQLEAGAFATSYIPTVASQVTRTADQCSIVAPNFAPWYNQSEGTFVFEGTVLGATGFSWPVVASDNTAANRLGMYRSGIAVAGFIIASNVTQMEVATTSVVANVPFKIGVAAQANSGNFSFNGNIGSTDTTITMPVVNKISLGSSASGAAEYLNGHIRSIRYYPTRLSNAQLQALTA